MKVEHFKKGETFKLLNNEFYPKKQLLLKVNVDVYMIDCKIYHGQTEEELADIQNGTFKDSECGKAIEVIVPGDSIGGSKFVFY
jgi:hypothetical protein